MRRKSARAKIPRFKIILFSTIIFALGIFILFFSFLMSDSSDSQDFIVDSVQSDSKDTVESITIEKEVAPEVALAPIPDTSIVDQKDPPKVVPLPVEPKPVSPPVKTKDGILVFIFDDGGHQLSQSQEFVNLPFPVTIAVLPQLADSVETAELVRNSGNELFLHQPMQAMNLNINPGPGAIFPDMTTGEAVSILRKNVLDIGPVKGVNNHEGSLITTDRNIMGAVVDACQDLGIMFLDSRTTAQTAVPMVAIERGMEILDRDVFIDNEKDKAYMKEMIEKGLDVADAQGYAIMIGHVTTPLLASLLDEMYGDLSAQGYTFSTPSKLNL